MAMTTDKRARPHPREKAISLRANEKELAEWHEVASLHGMALAQTARMLFKAELRRLRRMPTVDQ